MTKRTDWNAYYSRPYRTATITRRMMGRMLVDCMRRYAPRERPLHIVELGGANSCFYDTVARRMRPALYTVVDNHDAGLQAFRDRTGGQAVAVVQADILDLHLAVRADVVFSVGLIEHFSPRLTAKAIDAHFDLVAPGGIVLITFPTPTVLYRVTRGLSEHLGLWIFHDERPLEMADVLKDVERRGTVLRTKILWRMVLTQGLVVARTPSAS